MPVVGEKYLYLGGTSGLFYALHYAHGFKINILNVNESHIVVLIHTDRRILHNLSLESLFKDQT
jgi:uncharacterized membrane protein YobD (UPF0266 family)